MHSSDFATICLSGDWMNFIGFCSSTVCRELFMGNFYLENYYKEMYLLSVNVIKKSLPVHIKTITIYKTFQLSEVFFLQMIHLKCKGLLHLKCKLRVTMTLSSGGVDVCYSFLYSYHSWCFFRHVKPHSNNCNLECIPLLCYGE